MGSKNNVARRQEVQATFLGPIPPPALIREYKDIDESFPERIMKMAESHAKTEDDFKKSISVSFRLGQIFSFAFGIVSLGTCVWLVMKGAALGAIAPAVLGLSQIIVSGVSGRQKLD